MRDYLLRNFLLFRYSSTFDVRLDIEDAIERLKPHVSGAAQRARVCGVSRTNSKQRKKSKVSAVRRNGTEAATDFGGCVLLVCCVVRVCFCC